VEYLEETEKALEKLREEWNVHERKEVELSSFLQNKKASLLEQQQRLTQIIGENLLEELLNGINKELHSLKEREEETLKRWHLLNNEHQEVKASYESIVSSLAELNERYEEKERKWKDKRNSSGFHSDIDVKEMFITEEQQQKIREEVEAFWDKLKSVTIALENVTKLLDNQSVTEQSFKETSSILADLKESVKEATTELGSARALLKDLQVRNERLGSLEKEREKIQEELSQYQKLQSVFKGNAFIEYMAQEQLIAISRDASERLGFLTRQRYALEVDSQGGFVIRDDANGGVKRPISSLSGGETFLTSLSLALSLSAGIQLRGEYPLQFFFLDEGFGTLDSELLDTVITALEKLQSNDLSIGIISHVQELRARLPKRLIVEKADDLGNGTKVKVETL
jgi:exonuclease SbcC